MSDEEAIRELKSLKGVDVWTPEMILLFCMQRPNIFSYDDLAIQRGLRMVYHHSNIDRKLFEKYRHRFSLYCSVASLYLWAVAGGAIPKMKDYKPKATKKEKNEMVYPCKYKSLLGDILLAADEVGLMGLWFEGEKYFAKTLPDEHIPQETEVITKKKNGWMCISPVKN